MLAVIVLGGGFFRVRYPGMSEGMWHQLRYASLRDSSNLWQCVTYFLAAMEMLTFDPARKVWDFQGSPEAGQGELGLAILSFHRGEYNGAIALLEGLVARGGESEEALFWLAFITMRRAEAENCLAPLLAAGEPAGHPHDAHHGADHGAYCTLPISRFHDQQRDSRRAIELWTRLLDRHDPGNRLYRWLLNFSAMTIGGFPSEVPERYRITTPFTGAFYGRAAEEARLAAPWLRFTDRAAELGVENLGTGRGAAVEDFDGDGDLDLVTAATFGQVRLFSNDGGRGFVETTAAAGLEAASQPLSVAAADYDNDGRVDLFVVRPFDHYRLFRNEGGGRFRDVSRESGLLDAKPAGTNATSWFGAWADVEGDGDLDLFVSAWAFKVPFVGGLVAKPRLDSQLFLNQGGRFRDATRELGLSPFVHDRQLIGAAFGDYDLDGFPDLFLSGPIPDTSGLYRNDGGRRFVPVDLGSDFTEPGFTAAFVDIDQDGRLDIFQGGFNDARTATARSVFGDPGHQMGDSLFLLQRSDGSFEKRADLFEGGTGVSTMGAAYGDLDLDGCLDVYLGTGNPEPWFILPNRMFLGQRDGARCLGTMTDISALGGFANVQKGHSIVFFDFDDDGDQDVFSSLGGMWPADGWVSQLFVNDSETGNHWVKIRLEGTRSNRLGVGSRLKVTARRPDGSLLERYRQMDNATGFGSAPYLAHVGLLDAVEIVGVEVLWQGSGCRTTYGAELDRLNLLAEAQCLAEEATR